MKTALVFAVFATAVLVTFSEVLVGDQLFFDANPYGYAPWRSYGTEQDLSGKTYRMDSILSYLPRQVELCRSLQSRRIRLWNPYIFSGTPFFADPQSRVLYPISLLLGLVEPARAMGYDLAIHFLIAMMGMFLFLRRVGATILGSMIASFSYGFSSFFFVRLGHPTLIASASWIPFFFYGFEIAQRRERVGTLLLTVFFILGYLAGFPQVFLFGVGALVFYAAYLAVDGALAGTGSLWSRRARIILVSGLLSMLIVSVQLVPFWEFVRNAEGLNIELEKVKSVYVAPAVLLVRSIFPAFFGNAAEGTDWTGLTRQTENVYNPDFAVYCGAGTLLLALGGLAFLRKSPRIRAFWCLAVSSAGIATSGFLLGMAYKLLPIFRYSKVSRISVISCFAISALGGLSFSLILGAQAGRARKRFGYIVLSILGLVLVAALLFNLIGGSILERVIEKGESFSTRYWQTIYARNRSDRVKQWIDSGVPGWFAYQKRKVWNGLAAVSASAALMLFLLSRDPRIIRRRILICILLLMVIVADTGLSVRSQFISQPAGCIFETEGIRVLRKALGEDARWRLMRANFWLGESAVLPANTNQLFEIPSVGGRQTVFPDGYADLEASFRLSAVVSEGEGNRRYVAGAAADLVCAKYFLSPEIQYEFLASPVLREIAEHRGDRSRLRLVELGCESRLAVCQGAGEVLSARVFLPYKDTRRRSVERLDCWVGFRLDGETEGDSLTFLVECKTESGKVQANRSFDLQTGADRWHRLSLDVSSVSRRQGTVSMSVASSTGGDLKNVAAAWSDLALVFRDLVANRIDRGYELDIGKRPGGDLSLTLRSDARDLPLRITCGERFDIRRHLVFTPHTSSREIVLDLSHLEQSAARSRMVLRSDSAFSLLGSRLVYSVSSDPDYDLIYNGDMYVYENAAAVPKGFCVDKECVRGGDSDRGYVLRVTCPLEEIVDMRRGKVDIVSYEPERVLMDVSAERDCFLFFQDVFYPGWRAYVDGTETEIMRTGLGIRALELGRGQHLVEMTYQPGSLKYGLILTCAGLILSVAYARKWGPTRPR